MKGKIFLCISVAIAWCMGFMSPLSILACSSRAVLFAAVIELFAGFVGMDLIMAFELVFRGADVFSSSCVVRAILMFCFTAMLRN